MVQVAHMAWILCCYGFGDGSSCSSNSILAWEVPYATPAALKRKKNDIMLFAATWLVLAIIMESEISQKGKNKYCMLTNTCGILKNGTDKSIYGTGIEMQM